MKLENIGFYTLSDARAKQSSLTSPLWRCELILTGRCNFRCPYCRSIGGPDIDLNVAEHTIRLWGEMGLKNIRFSGGEPTLHSGLAYLVGLAKDVGVERIAVSTNGSASLDVYQRLVQAGVNDFSVSLDACCAEDNERMTGGAKGAWDTVVSNIRALSAMTYTTVGIVLTDMNIGKVNDTIRFASNLGVADIRVIPAAQNGTRLYQLKVDADLMATHPILRYRMLNIIEGRRVRGLGETDSSRCPLVLDDMAVMGDKHYPCIIYLREGGRPIGCVGPHMREERMTWATEHDTYRDPICRMNCLDVCKDFNKRWFE